VGSITVPRSEYRLVQTPQAFDIQLHKKAYRQPFNNGFTDDASVVEAYLNDVQACNRNPSLGEGHRVGSITLVEGNRENIKITTPFDLLVAEAIVKLES
jgi:2-C-methyl-D-erythritol 4-phosphate cytidylyltransferase